MRYLLFVGLVIATWRVTRLLVLDKIRPVAAVREWFISMFATVDESGMIVGGRRNGWIGWSLAYVWTCMWCMSPWVGAALWGLARWRHVDVPYPWLMIACGSGLAGILGEAESISDQRYKLREAEIVKLVAGTTEVERERARPFL